MILVISDVANDGASSLVNMFPAGAASLVTASTLDTEFAAAVTVGDFANSHFTVGGTRIGPAQISGVVSTIAYFSPREFYYVREADREYACAEATAMFIYLLSELRCRKLNPSSATTLCGLGMHRIQWMRLAQGWGFPVWPYAVKRDAAPSPAAPRGTRRIEATIVGGSVVGEGTPDRVAELVRGLSRSFDMPYLRAAFVSPRDGDYFLADLWSVPDLSVEANRDAIVRFMSERAA